MTEIPLTGFGPATGMPTDATAFTPAMLNEMIAPWHPDIRITRIRILENKAYGDGMVSTAARAVLDVEYAEGAPAGLPQRVILKLGRPPDFLIGPLYQHEQRFYTRLLHELTQLKRTFTLGGASDTETQQIP